LDTGKVLAEVGYVMVADILVAVAVDIVAVGYVMLAEVAVAVDIVVVVDYMPGCTLVVVAVDYILVVDCTLAVAENNPVGDSLVKCLPEDFVPDKIEEVRY